MHRQSLSGQWDFCQVNTGEWQTATVPGGVHTDLLALGRSAARLDDIHLRQQHEAGAVTAASLARHVELSIAGADVVFSDNYFDLPAWRTMTVTCPLPDGSDIDQVCRALQVRSLYDSFA